MITKIDIKLFLLFNIILCTCYLSFAYGQTHPDRDKKIQEYVSRVMSSKDASGVILVALNGEPVLRVGYGWADIERHIPMTTEHSFAVGSLTKQFTALLTLKLVELGKLSLNDDITNYFPDCVNFNGVSILHLLTHSSGIKDLFKIEEWRKDLTINLSHAQTLEMIKKQNLEFSPGTKIAYSNSGYYLLGLIIEQITGNTLNQCLKKYIINPLDLSTTCFNDDKIPGIPTAKGYEIRDGKRVKPDSVSHTRYYAGGSIITTIDDLMKWDEALYNESLVKSGTLDLYFKSFMLNNNEESTMACGWEITSYGGIKIFGHGGGINGYVCQIYRVPQKRLYVAVLSNVVGSATPYSVSGIAQQILSIMLDGSGADSSQSKITLSNDELSEYAGQYSLRNGEIREIIVEENKMYYRLDESRKMELFPESRTKFHAGRASTLIFSFNEDGHVDQCEIFTGRGRAIILTKIK